MIEAPEKIVTLEIHSLSMQSRTYRLLGLYAQFLEKKSGSPWKVEDILVGCLEKELKSDEDFAKYANENAHLDVDISKKSTRSRRKPDSGLLQKKRMNLRSQEAKAEE